MFEAKVITLDSAKERQERIKENLKDTIPFSFSKGYDWKNMRFEMDSECALVHFDECRIKINSDMFLKNTGRNWFRFGEVGNYLAHYVLWKEMVDKSIPYLLILEDDCSLCSTFNTKNLDGLAQNIDENIDVIYLQSVSAHMQKRSSMLNTNIPDKFIRIRDKARFLVEGTAAYIITLSGAKKLVDDCEVNGWCGPVDNMIARNIEEDNLNVVVPKNIDDFFELDSMVGFQEVSQTHSGDFSKRKIIGNLVVQYRENEEVQYA